MSQPRKSHPVCGRVGPRALFALTGSGRNVLQRYCGHLPSGFRGCFPGKSGSALGSSSSSWEGPPRRRLLRTEKPGHTSLTLRARDPALTIPQPGAHRRGTNPAIPRPGGEGVGALEGRTPSLLGTTCEVRLASVRHRGAGIGNSKHPQGWKTPVGVPDCRGSGAADTKPTTCLWGTEHTAVVQCQLPQPRPEPCIPARKTPLPSFFWGIHPEAEVYAHHLKTPEKVMAR